MDMEHLFDSGIIPHWTTPVRSCKNLKRLRGQTKAENTPGSKQ